MTTSTNSTIPDRLFIFELANNHMGSVEHGLRVIREMAAVSKDYDFNFAFKLQYRELDTFIHPDFKGRMDIKYIKRFSETRLSRDDTRRLVDEVKKHGFTAICTPFDEPSVDNIVADNYDILKIASCSFTDWPLLEKMVATDLPIIGSTAGVDQESIDNVVSFLTNRDKDFVLMHCVAEYPTPSEKLQLNHIDYLRRRYPQVRIGYSTHEDPDETAAVAIAIGKGAMALEKHVGVPTPDWPLNAYSANPEQVGKWLGAAKHAYAVLGDEEGALKPTEAELESLRGLRRGAYAKRDIAPGERIHSDDIFFAIPVQEEHVTANDWSKYLQVSATQPIAANQPLLASNTSQANIRERVYGIVGRVKNALEQANVVFPGTANFEISHHYGLEKFEEFGLTMMTVVNRDYCKKIIVVLPGQKHPEQSHKIKEETFHVLDGEMVLYLDGVPRTLRRSDVVTIEAGVKHAFETESGVIFEEISSNHQASDSFYTDPAITENKDRKTYLMHWPS